MALGAQERLGQKLERTFPWPAHPTVRLPSFPAQNGLLETIVLIAEFTMFSPIMLCLGVYSGWRSRGGSYTEEPEAGRCRLQLPCFLEQGRSETRMASQGRSETRMASTKHLRTEFQMPTNNELTCPSKFPSLSHVPTFLLVLPEIT